MTNSVTKLAAYRRVRSEMTAADTPTQLGQRMIRSVDEAVELQAQRRAASEEFALVASLTAELTGFGALQPFLQDPEIEEVWINRPGEIRYAIGGKSHCAAAQFSAAELENLVFRLLRGSARRVDRIHPFADATLADGSRVHVAIPPITKGDWTLNVRKFPARPRTLAELVDLGMLESAEASVLQEAVQEGKNFVVSGATQAGKTTLLSALLGELPENTRVVSIEETHELQINCADWVAMQGRAESVGDSAPIDLRRLLRESLRMRPDQLVVGEVRGAEALELLLAMNTGLPCAATIHAKSAQAAVEKLKLLPALAQSNIDHGFLEATVNSVLDFVVQVQRVDGKRKVSEISWVAK